jgi:hypothetical protein
MEIHYCHSCSMELGLLNFGGIQQFNLTGSTYQLTKFIKHTVPPTQSGLVSIFNDPSYGAYKEHVVSTLTSGSTMFDQRGRKNIIWYAHLDVGASYLNGVVQNTADVVKVVLPSRVDKIHCFPISMRTLGSRNCIRCGIDVLIG